ncbi:MAG: hypothetical protein ACPG4X_21020 [Pikeienuella sp.]
MERPVIEIPVSFFLKLNMDWDIDWRGQSVGEATGGNTQVVYNRFPRWIGTPEVFLYGDKIRQWRALRARAQGRVGIYSIAMCDPAGYIDVNAGLFETGIPFSNGEPFSTGFGWEYRPYFMAVSDYGPGATTIRVDVGPMNGAVPLEGQIMSHNDWPFIVDHVANVSGDIYDLAIQMPLRSTIAIDDRIDLMPRGRFEAIEDMMGNPAYGASRTSKIRLQFREVLTR